jgi:thioredoxin-dependent peroxiredoxin
MTETAADPMIGAPAPGFCLPDASGDTVCLEEFRGHWVVLYIYPRDGTPACTLEARLFSDALDAFETLDATVLGVSPDPPGKHAAFARKYGLRHRLLSDEKHDLLEPYGAWKEKRLYGKVIMGTERSTFLIDTLGTIRAVWRRVKVPGHPDTVLETLASLVTEWR